MIDPKDPKEPELKEDELKHVTGGAVDTFLTLEGIKGESKDDAPAQKIE